MERKILKKELLLTWLEALRHTGKKIIAPQKRDDQVDFMLLEAGEPLTEGFVQTVQSAKSFIFPKVEELFRFHETLEGVKLEEPDVQDLPEIVLFGLRPCDTRSITALKAIFTKNYQDSQFLNRLEKLTIIGLSCKTADEYCFCTSVGGNPGGTDGSDILLSERENGDFLVETVTEKGEKAMQAALELFKADDNIVKEPLLAKVIKQFEIQELPKKLVALFGQDKIWIEQSLGCLGCGACAFVCPTCACFDIQDEGDAQEGWRLRCWDSCGFSLFTLHTSGHNPREKQSQRWRQRVMHKFSYMPDQLNVMGCVGCGRCSRACPVDMNLLEHLKTIMEAD